MLKIRYEYREKDAFFVDGPTETANKRINDKGNGMKPEMVGKEQLTVSFRLSSRLPLSFPKY
jgi:hypothetical protein